MKVVIFFCFIYFVLAASPAKQPSLNITNDLLYGLADGLALFHYIDLKEASICFKSSEEVQSDWEELTKVIGKIKSFIDLIEQSSVIVQLTTRLIKDAESHITNKCWGVFTGALKFTNDIKAQVLSDSYGKKIISRVAKDSVFLVSYSIDLSETIKRSKWEKVGRKIGQKARYLFFPLTDL